MLLLSVISYTFAFQTFFIFSFLHKNCNMPFSQNIVYKIPMLRTKRKLLYKNNGNASRYQKPKSIAVLI